MLKLYKIGERIFQFEKGCQPAGAVEYRPEAATPVTPEAPRPAARKRAASKNKVVEASNK